MRSYEEIRKNRLLIENNRLAVARKRLNGSLNTARNIRQKEQIDYSTAVIENIDEVVKIQISYNANLLFDLVSKETKFTVFTKMFYAKILEYIRYIENPKINLNSSFNPEIVELINFFGFTKKDILSLVDVNMNVSLKDEFIGFINEIYNTNIPRLSEWFELDDDLRDKLNDEELKNIDIYTIYLQFRNGDFVVEKFGCIYPLLYESDIVEYFGDEYIYSVSLKKIRSK